jgi:RHS repeat-associated protein
MLLPNRHGTSDSYRYGFNGMEKDDEVKGEGNSYDFGNRMYDSRIGRWFRTDPFEKKLESYSPYAFALNSPITVIDKDGNFPVWLHYAMTYNSLIKAGVDKQTAHEIAHYASTYADHPNNTFMILNQALAINYATDPRRLSYSEDLGPYDLNFSQDDDLIVAVSIHAMRTYWEDITPDQAVERALFGGEYLNNDGTQVVIVGAYQIVNSLEGIDFKDLTKEQKKLLGTALHTIQDAVIHKGGRWVDKHKDEAELIYGNSSEHPDLKESLMAFRETSETREANEKTDKVVERMKKSSEKKRSKEKKRSNEKKEVNKKG